MKRVFQVAKRYISVFLAVAMMATVLTAAPQSVSADGWGTDATGQMTDAMESLNKAIGKAGDAGGFLKYCSITFSTGSAIFSLYETTVSVLQMFGVMEDPTAKFQQTVLSKLNNLQTTVDTVNANVTKLTGMVIKGNAMAIEKTAAVARNTYITNLTTYKNGIESKKNKCYTDMVGQVNLKLMNWYKSDSAEDFEVSVPKKAEDNGETYLLTIPGKYIAEARAAFRAEHPWDAGEGVGYVMQVVKDAFRNVLNSGDTNLTGVLLNKWLFGYGENRFSYLSYYNDIIETVGECAYKAMAFDAMNDYCLKNDAAFTKDVVSVFNDYTDLLCSAGSPVRNKFGIFENTFVFQGDMTYTTEDGEVRNYAMDARDSELIELARFALFAVSIAKASGIYDGKDLVGRMEKAIAAINKDYNNFYKMEGTNAPADNYSYQLKGVVDYVPLTVSSKAWIAYHREKEYGYSIYEDHYCGGWQAGKVPSGSTIIGGDDMALLYYRHLMLSTEADAPACLVGTTGNFPAYMAYKMGEERMDGQVVTEMTGAEKLDPMTPMCAMDVDIGSYYTKHYFRNFYGNKTKIEVFDDSRYDGLKATDEYFILKDCYKGDLFNMANGEFTSGARLAARAIYEEDHWYWDSDEMGFFWEGEYGEEGAFCPLQWRTGKDEDYIYFTRYLNVERKYHAFTLRSLSKELGQKEQPSSFFASILSTGSIIVLSVVAALAVGGVTTILVLRKKKKKKTAAADEEEKKVEA